MSKKTAEESRLKQVGQDGVSPWQKWGAYVAERAWGTVREDYSCNGDAWSYFPFEMAHEKVYRWGDDGIAGFCDRYQILLFSPAFWNGKDPILKERLFGLSSHEGNHGEDVKECYYYLDATPTHSYMKYLYKYPQAEFPYELLKKVNAKRSLEEAEYELIDTGVFADNNYFDIFIEYAKASPEDICIRIEAFNRAKESASLHILPQLWFRNQWSWGDVALCKPQISNLSLNQNSLLICADDSQLSSLGNLSFDYRLGKRYLYASPGGRALFTDNENSSLNQKYHKAGFHEAIIKGKASTNPEEKGTKAGLHYFFKAIPAHQSVSILLRLTDTPSSHPLQDVEKIIDKRKKQADDFYATIHPQGASVDECRVQRQALAGVLWSKQFYFFDVNQWLQGDNTHSPPPQGRAHIRNKHWRHLNSMRILLMPDKWEYPWFAAWDLAFHTLSLALVDIEGAKEQLWLLLFDQFQHPNGAIPAYEWEFSDLNPPVQAFAALRLYHIQKRKYGIEDRDFLKKCFLKLIMNFAYWVNKVDNSGSNVFEGGFLGLDNITLLDRSQNLKDGTSLKQSDGTGWMATFSLHLMRIALELAKQEPVYETLATKFFQHFVYIAHAMKMMGDKQHCMWNKKDSFFYDVLVYPDGNYSSFQVRSLVGLIPLYAVDILEEKELDQLPEFKANFLWFLKNRATLTEECISFVAEQKHYVCTLVKKEDLQKILRYVCDPQEFLSDYGLRSLSKYHQEHPFHFKDLHVGYEPAESTLRIKGGNSNWRGPIWMPTNYLIIDSLKMFARAFGEKLIIASQEEMTIEQITTSLANRLISLFTLNLSGKRPVLGEDFPFANDPYFQNHILFYEYYHGDLGKGLGASHQTGWSALVANLIDEFRQDGVLKNS